MEIYQLLRAPALRTTWLQNILQPVAAAARVTSPHGINLQPLSPGLGGHSPGAGAPAAARVHLSNRALYWTRGGLIDVWLHEMAHTLLEEAEPTVAHGHDAVFFCVNAALLLQLDLKKHLHDERVSLWLENLSLYDLCDPPPPWKEEKQLTVWLSRAMTWALDTAFELVDLELEASALAREACARYAAQVKVWEREPLQAKARAAAQRQMAQELATAKANARLGFAGSVALAVLLGLVVLAR